MNQNAPSSSPQENKVFNALEHKEMLLSELGIDIRYLDDWSENVIGKLAGTLPLPYDSAQGEAVKEELRIRLFEMENQERGQPFIIKALALVYRASEELKASLKPNGIPPTITLSTIDLDNIKRHIANFINARFVYEKMWNGETSSGQTVPEYLAKFLEQRGSEEFAIRIAGHVLPFQYDVLDDAGVSTSPGELSLISEGILLGATGRQLKFKHVMSCLDKLGEDYTLKPGKKPYEDFLLLAGYKEEHLDQLHIEATKMLIGYLRKNLKSIRKLAAIEHADKGGDVNELTIGQAVEASVNTEFVSNIVTEIATAAKGFNFLSGDLPDISSAVEKMLDNSEMYTDAAVQIALAPFAEANGLDIDTMSQVGAKKFKEDAAEVLKFFMSYKAKKVSAGRVFGSNEQIDFMSSDRQELVRSLIKNVTTEDTVDGLLRSIFIQSDGKVSGIAKEVVDTITELVIEKKITAHEAFKIQFLQQNGNGVALAYQAISILKAHGQSRLATDTQHRVFSNYAKLAFENADSLEKISDDLGLFPEQQTELSNVSRYFKEKGVDLVTGFKDQYVSWWRHYPKIMGGIHAITLATPAVGAGVLLYRGHMRVRWDGIERFSTLTHSKLLAHLESQLGSTPSPAMIKRAKALQKEVQTVVTKMTSAHLRNHILRWPPQPINAVTYRAQLRNKGNILMQSASPGDLDDIAKALKSTYPDPSDVARAMQEMGPEQYVRRSMVKSGFTATQVDDAVRLLAEEGISIGGLQGPEALSKAARIQQRIGMFLRNVSNNMLLDQLARNPTNAALRTTAARRILGRRFLLPSVKRAILAAHKLPVTDLAGKTAILQKVFKNSDDITLLMRAGICGDTKKAMANFASVSPSPVTAADEVVRSFANVGAQSADDVLVKTGATVSRQATAAEGQLLQRWWSSPAFKEILHYGGVAFQGYVVYSDLMALEQAEKHYQSAQENAKKHLDSLVALEDGGWTLDGNTYTYKDKVSIRLDQIGSDTGKTAANWRLATDAAALGIMISMGAKAFAGPPGWALIGAEVVIHTAVSAWETSEYYAFVKNVDPALLAYLGGTAATIGPEEYSVLEDKIIDIFPLGKDIKVRKRIVFSWFMTHIAHANPKAYNEIVGLKSYDGMNQFFEKDFQGHILPNMQTHLMLNARSADLDMDFFQKLDVTNFFNVISKQDMEKAFRESANWYVLHIREQRYIDTLALYEKEENPEIRSRLELPLYELGSKHVFGRRLMDQKEEILKNNGQSRMSLMAESMQKHLRDASNSGTWLDAMKSPDNGSGRYKFKHTPRTVVDAFTGKKTSETEHSSYARDFTFDVLDIHGVQSDEEHAGQLWYSDVLTRASTPTVPQVRDAIADVRSLFIPKIFENLASGQSTLQQVRGTLLSHQRRLERLNRYIIQLSTVEEYKSQRMALMPEQDEMQTALETLYKNRKESFYSYFGVVTEKQLRKKYDDLCTRTSALLQKKLDEQDKLEDLIEGELKGYPEIAQYKDLGLHDLSELYKEELKVYYKDLMDAELFSDGVVAEHAHFLGITTHPAASSNEADVDTSSPIDELTNSLYASDQGHAPVLYSGDIPKEPSVIDIRHFQNFAQYPYLDTSINQFDTLHPSHLLSIHIHNERSTNGDSEYLATYSYSRIQNDAKPEEKDIVYIQIGGIAKEGSGHMEIGLPVQVFNKSAYFASGVNALRENQQGNTQEMLRNASRSERLFRAGDIMNDLVQVSRTEWAVRFHEKGKHVFYLIKVNPDGSVQSKKLEYDHAEESIQENALQYLSREEAYKKTGSMQARNYTKAEQGFGKQIEQDLEKQEWGAVPAELVTKFTLSTGDPSQFTNAIPLPFEGAAPAMQFGGVDGIVDKLGLRAAAPGQPGLDEGTIARVKGVIEMMHRKLDLQLGAESFAYQGAFELAFDQLMSVNSEDISIEPPDRQREMIKNIMVEAARRVDQQMPQRGTAAQQSLIDATESEGFGAY